MQQLSSPEVTSFYKKLQIALPDCRDNRGKRHDLHFVIICFIMGVLYGRTTVSGIHRYMFHRFEELCSITGSTNEHPISRAQLPRVLAKADWELINDLCVSCFGFTIAQNTYSSSAMSEWVAIDGKEQRGTIQRDDSGKKATRGLANVRAIRHADRHLMGTTYYEGAKDSEINAVRDLLNKPQIKGSSVTLDALHCNPKTTALIVHNEGRYIVQVKDNQKELHTDLSHLTTYTKPTYQTKEVVEKHHGRIEQRQYRLYDIQEEYFDKRWEHSHIRTLIVADRQFEQVKTGKLSQEKSYYISNQVLPEVPDSMAEQLAKAVRGHWQVESDNQVRDVTLKEDELKIKDYNLAKVVAVLWSVALEVLKLIKPKNYRAQIQLFNDKHQDMEKCLKNVKFL